MRWLGLLLLVAGSFLYWLHPRLAFIMRLTGLICFTLGLSFGPPPRWMPK